MSARLAALQRREWGRLLSLLVARTRRLDLAEDALADAFARALQRWPVDGEPANPSAWLYTTGWRGVVGRLRAEAVAGRAVPLLAVRQPSVAPAADDGVSDTPAGAPADELGDERLSLLLLCCHPALSADARSALALRLVIGTPTDEIARLFLVPLPTMAARITRAKQKIVGAGIPLDVPAGQALHERLDVVCRTVYLAFTAGYAPGAGAELLRADLAGEAVELARVAHQLLPDDTRTSALLALLLLQHARRDARAEGGRLITLTDQDRTRWRADEIAEGLGLLQPLAPTSGYGEELRLQACIAAEHARASAAAATDWPAIAHWYAALDDVTGSPVVRLNRAVAVADAHGAVAGLRLLDGLDEHLGDHHRLHAVRAELAFRAGDRSTAATAARRAVESCDNDVERAFLVDRLAVIEGSASR